MGTKQFIQIPRKFLDLEAGTKFIDILVYSIIDFQKDSHTHKSRIGVRTIAEKYNITLVKVEESIKRLKDNGFIDYVHLPSEKYANYVFNEYTLPNYKNNYLMMKHDILTLPLKAKERGVLIYLQLIAIHGLNDIYETNIEDIAIRLKISRQTMSKYLKMFIQMNLIQKSKNGIYSCQYLFKDSQDNKLRNTTIIL